MSHTTRHLCRRGGACRARKDRTGSGKPFCRLLPSWLRCEPGNSPHSTTSATSQKCRNGRPHKAHDTWSLAQGKPPCLGHSDIHCKQEKQWEEIISGSAQLRYYETSGYLEQS